MKLKNLVSKLCTKIVQSADSYVKESEEHINEVKDIHSFGKLMAYDRLDLSQEVDTSIVSHLRKNKDEEDDITLLENFFISKVTTKEVEKSSIIYFNK